MTDGCKARSSTVFDLVIVGAGPAGLSAAITAHANKLNVLVVDEQHDVGGQIFRQPPSEFKVRKQGHSGGNWPPEQLLEKARGAMALTWRLGTTAWGVFREAGAVGMTVALAGPEGNELVRTKFLLVATGAYDLPVAFPGWTLPGVMTAGGVQTLMKSQFLRPGHRFVLAGSHPLLLLVAELLIEAGAEIAEIAIARSRPSLAEIVAAMPAIPGHVRLIAGFVRSCWRLWKAGVPLRFSTVVTHASGSERVEGVTLCSIDADWRVIPGEERKVDADTLVIGYGLIASTELARQAGCAIEWRPAEGGWIIQHDADMRTSVEDIYVAGEPSGVAGAEVAMHEGRLAALSIIESLGRSSRGHLVERAAARRAAVTASRFSDVVSAFFAPRLDALAQLATDKTVLCRCEEVEVGDVSAFLDANPHISELNSLKQGCRVGMGFCQGRYCHVTAAHLLAERCGVSAEQVGMFEAQVPVKPVTVGSLADLSATLERTLQTPSIV